MLRQYDLLLNQVHKIYSIKDVEFLRENENDVLNTIRTFGRFNINYNNIANDFIHNEDYICPQDDHDFMYKELTNNRAEKLNMIEKKEIIDFSNNKLTLKENANNINDSIINITINESKELIDKTSSDNQQIQPSGEVYYDNEINVNHELKDDVEHNIPPNIEEGNLDYSLSNNSSQNNINHNISFKSFTNFSIKPRNREKFHNVMLQSHKIPIITSEEFLHKATHHEDIECEFYKRLLTETKLINKNNNNNNKTQKSVIHHIYHELPTTSSKLGCGNEKKLKKSFECENSIIYDHPIQVQQWLKQIIYEADSEPLQNIEILEHSHIDVN